MACRTFQCRPNYASIRFGGGIKENQRKEKKKGINALRHFNILWIAIAYIYIYIYIYLHTVAQ